MLPLLLQRHTTFFLPASQPPFAIASSSVRIQTLTELHFIQGYFGFRRRLNFYPPLTDTEQQLYSHLSVVSRERTAAAHSQLEHTIPSESNGWREKKKSGVHLVKNLLLLAQYKHALEFACLPICWVCTFTHSLTCVVTRTQVDRTLDVWLTSAILRLIDSDDFCSSALGFRARLGEISKFPSFSTLWYELVRLVLS